MAAIRDTAQTDRLNNCYICGFPVGRFINKTTKERRAYFLYKSIEGKYVCNWCVDSSRGIRLRKVSKRERKEKRRLLRKKLGI